MEAKRIIDNLQIPLGLTEINVKKSLRGGGGSVQYGGVQYTVEQLRELAARDEINVGNIDYATP